MKKLLWLFWGLSSVALAGFLGYELLVLPEKPTFHIGSSSSGHYQIELACSACHTEPFGGGEVIQNACLNCHKDELEKALDSHPVKKFNDPRHADLVSILDARYCASCHKEHNPDVLHDMGVSLPDDYCVQCHQDIAEERPSHEGMGFDTCASAGCHNYHDNRALYEDFLLKHSADQLLHLDTSNLSTLKKYLDSTGVKWQGDDELIEVSKALYLQYPEQHADWLQSAHYSNDVGCLTCHNVPENKKLGTNNELNIVNELQLDKPVDEVCVTCHEEETLGFQSGKHGMRVKQALQPMHPSMARLAMHESGSGALSCASCHDPHKTDRTFAAVDACLSCHNDEHSQAYKQSKHASLDGIQQVTCATCHMPTEVKTIKGHKLLGVEHNQNATLRPNEKMIRSSCLTCHNLQFSLDALADEALIKMNFNGQPSTHIPSIDMARERDNKKMQ